MKGIGPTYTPKAMTPATCPHRGLPAHRGLQRRRPARLLAQNVVDALHRGSLLDFTSASPRATEAERKCPHISLVSHAVATLVPCWADCSVPSQAKEVRPERGLKGARRSEAPAGWEVLLGIMDSGSSSLGMFLEPLSNVRSE